MSDNTKTVRMGMKMAKASENDIEQTLSLVGALEAISKGYYPSNPDTDAEREDEPIFFDEDDPGHLRVFYDRVKARLDAAPGGIFRVVFGFVTMMSNNIVDPDLDHLELHPRITEALARPPADLRSLAYPHAMTSALRHVLSMMCFQLGPFAHIFRAAGADIKTRAEDEQAYCLHWLIKHVLLHGDAWADHAEADLVDARAKIQGEAK